jgi:LuxR family transcriptional regulator, maltose regulon positive regulatory protein
VGLVESSPRAPTSEFDPAGWFGPSFLVERSKLEPPRPRVGTVARTALLDRLQASASVPVLAIAAPPGYGKSAFLAQWAEQAPGRVAWLSLEREDNDPAVLLAYIAAALHRLEPIDVGILRTRAAPSASVAAIVARRVAATLSSLDGPVTLVLDHTEVLRNTQCRDAIAELALHLPPAARLAVASRETPPVPLATLRTRGAVVEVGVDDLAMNASEARLLLAGAGVEVDDAQVGDLVRRTEGWPVGLYLAALAVKGGGRQESAALAFAGDHRLMADYLRTELLAHVPRGRVSFLIRTSVLDRMCGPLCDAVLDRSRSGRLLEDLEASNLLLVPLDSHREWYRYHKLFQQLLRFELHQREEEVITGLHSRAAEWCAANGHHEMAIAHAQAAGDADEVARLVEHHLQPTYASGRLETVSRWLQWFDDRGTIDRYPGVATLGAIVRALMGQAAAAERWAAAAERAPADVTFRDGSTLEGWRAMLRALLCRKGVSEMRRDAQCAHEDMTSTSRWRPVALALEGVSWLLEGDDDRADPLLMRAAAMGRDIDAWPVTTAALAERAIVAIRRDDWHDAGTLAESAVAIVRDAGLDDYGTSALVEAVAARTAAHHGDLESARERLAAAARLRPQLSYVLPFYSVQALLELARTYLALADPVGARVVLREARDILRLRPDLGNLPGEVEDLSATIDTLRAGAVGASSLTTAELRLIPLLSTHLSFREIGERLHVSRHTVKTQAISVYRKLGVASRSEAIARAQSVGLLSL